MGTRWTWFFGIATVAALAITFLVLPSTLPGFDWLSFGAGTVAGATVAGLIAALIWPHEPKQPKPPKVKPRTEPTNVPNASFVSPRTAGRKSHGPRLESYQIVPAGRRFVWINSGGRAGTITPDGEGFMLSDADGYEVRRVANEAEAVSAILQGLE